MQNVINIDAWILDGAPLFDGTRIPIKNLFDHLKNGKTIDEFLHEFAVVKREQVIELLEMLEKLAT